MGIQAAPRPTDTNDALVKRQRARGSGKLAVVASNGRTRLAQCFQEGCAKIRFPQRPPREPGMEAVLINTAGGLTGGDRLQWQIVAGEGTGLTLSAPAAEKIYRAGGAVARINIAISVAAGAHVSWLPQETILFNDSALERRIEAQLADGASFLAVEAFVAGRKAHGERLEDSHFRDRWRVRIGEALVHAEELRFDGAFDALAGPGLAADHLAFATVLLVHPAALDLADQAYGILSKGTAIFGVSALEIAGHGKILARLAARDGLALRQSLVPLVSMLNSRAGGGQAMPRIWST
jgi:urease accessory protein